MIETLIQIRGANETNQSSTTSVRSSRKTSPSSANVRARRISESSSQTMRVRIRLRNEPKEKEVSDFGVPPISVVAKRWMHTRSTGPHRIARKKALYRSPDGRLAGVAKLGQRRRT